MLVGSAHKPEYTADLCIRRCVCACVRACVCVCVCVWFVCVCVSECAAGRQAGALDPEGNFLALALVIFHHARMRQGAKPERWIQSWAQDFCRCPAAAAAAAVAAARLDSLGRLGLTQRLRDLGRIDPSL